MGAKKEDVVVFVQHIKKIASHLLKEITQGSFYFCNCIRNLSNVDSTAMQVKFLTSKVSKVVKKPL